MDRNRRIRTYCTYLYAFAALVALMGGLKMYRSSHDLFPQRNLPSLGATADAAIRVVQRETSDERFEGGIQLLLCALVIAGAGVRLSKEARASGATPPG